MSELEGGVTSEVQRSEQMASEKKAEAAAEVEVELISRAIQRLREEERNRAASSRTSDGDADDLLLLSRLLSQVESTREEQRRLNHSQLSAQQEDENPISANSEPRQSETVEESREEEIVKELKEVKRQNFITHCLVSAMIILTVAWQVSEVSLILKLRDGLSNPFKSLGTILKRKTTSAIQHQVDATELPPYLNMPPLPHVTLPDFRLDAE